MCIKFSNSDHNKINIDNITSDWILWQLLNKETFLYYNQFSDYNISFHSKILINIPTHLQQTSVQTSHN